MLEKTYSLDEVAANNGSDGSRVWIIIKGGVYDVTDFIDSHPGGGELIKEFAGKDATKAFNKAGHSSDATTDLKKYKIGIVSDKPIIPAENRYSNQSEISLTPSAKSEKRRRIKFLFCL